MDEYRSRAADSVAGRSTRSPQDRLCQNLAQRCPQAGMIVGHDKFDAVQTARLRPQQEIAPARPALAVGELDRQYLAPRVKPVG
jgi:hypothetical protein